MLLFFTFLSSKNPEEKKMHHVFNNHKKLSSTTVFNIDIKKKVSPKTLNIWNGMKLNI